MTSPDEVAAVRMTEKHAEFWLIVRGARLFSIEELEVLAEIEANISSQASGMTVPVNVEEIREAIRKGESTGHVSGASREHYIALLRSWLPSSTQEGK